MDFIEIIEKIMMYLLYCVAGVVVIISFVLVGTMLFVNIF
jgi:hypothetical protein